MEFHWTTGKVVFVYFSGILLGSSVLLLVQAIATDSSLVGPVLGVLVALMLPVLPFVAASRRRAP